MRAALVACLAAFAPFALVGPAVVAPARAQPSSCTGDVVTLGDDVATVRAKCGEPRGKRTGCAATEPQVFGTPPRAPTDAPCTPVERWTYRATSNQPTIVLEFEAGRLRAIDDDRSATSPSDR